MIEPDKKRIAGMHVTNEGNIAVVWLAVDNQIGDVFVYDTALFKREVPIVIAESLNARGRNIPIAWANKPIADQLKEKGCRMLWDSCDESNPIAEVTSKEIWERIRTKRFRVDKRLGDIIAEMQTLERVDGKIPTDSHPLMAAARNAMQMLKYAKRLQAPKTRVKPIRQVAIV